MTNFNLLPQHYKKALRWEIFSHIFYASTFLFVVWMAVFAIIVFTAHQYLFIQNNALRDRIENALSAKETQEARELEDQITSLNVLLLKIKDIQAEQGYDVSILLERIAPMVPQGSSLDNFLYSAGSQLIILRGNAQLRSQVITLQQRLEEEELFSNVEAPITNLLRSEDVDFSFTITLEKNKDD